MSAYTLFLSLPPSPCSITVASVVVYSVELAVLKDFHYWSKGTVTLYVSASAAILSSQRTIVVNHIVWNILLYNTLCPSVVC